MTDFSEFLRQVSIWAIPAVFAITLHEVAHGYVARLLGDRTAEMLGRLTVNPIKHIDPVGTVLVPLVLLLLPGNFIFGWAKPVPVATRNLRNPKRDMAIVAAAGPTANLLMAIFWGFVAKIGHLLQLEALTPWLVSVGAAGILVNLVLGVLNLLPIPPLDGGRVLSGLLPNRFSDPLDRVEPYGFLVVVALLALGVLNLLLAPPIIFLRDLIITITGLR